MHASYFLVKIGRALITMLMVVTFVFIVLRATGDPADIFLPDEATDEDRAAFRSEWGLDKPLWEQYLVYWSNVFRGDLCESYRDHREVKTILAERLPKTFYLMGLSLAFSLLVSIPLGVNAALHRNSVLDRFTMSVAVFGFSMPNFFLGILLILFFSVQLRVLPSSGSETWKHVLLPVLTSAMSHLGSYSRFTRSTMLSVLNRPFIRASTAKGLSRNRVIYGHALPNAAIPIVTIVGTSIGRMVTGSIVIETVFAWPGVGRLLVSSVGSRDLAVVQAIVLILCISIVAANLAVDLLYGVLDPRIRISKEG